MTTKPTVAWTGSEWVSIAPPAVPGIDAYARAKLDGYEGTFEEWLEDIKGARGPAGPIGLPGPMGVGGAPGPTLPPGGQEGQYLAKASGSDYDYEWVTAYAVEQGAPGSATSTYTDLFVADGTITGGTKTSYTDVHGITYNVHTFQYTGSTASLVVTAPVIGDLLVVAGGGPSGSSLSSNTYTGGGGGAGGLIYQQYAFGTGTHNLYVGNGGQTYQSTGQNSTFDDLTALGGGYGGRGGDLFGGGLPGGNGGSGGGGGENTGNDGRSTVQLGGLGTPGQGNDGANSGGTISGNGGGAGAPGNLGGEGRRIGITGTDVWYASGGSGTSTATPTPHTGNGGNGTWYVIPGATGVVIVRYRIV